MLQMLKFFPDQVARHWEQIGYWIEQALPPIVDSRKSSERMNNILESILVGRLDVHLFLIYEDEKPTIYATMVTAIILSVDSNDKELLIYSVYGSRRMGKQILFEGLELIKKYAKSAGCSAITAYTNAEGIKALFKNIGGDSSFTYLRLEI